MNYFDHNNASNQLPTEKTVYEEFRDLKNYYFMGLDAFNAKNMKEAAFYFGTYLNRPGEIYRFQSYKFLILTFVYLKDYKQTSEIIKKCRREFELDQDILNIWGYVLYDDGNIQEAIKLYRYILFYEPQNITALNGLGFSLLEDSKNQDYPEALKILQNAYKYSNTQDPRILDSLGWAFFKNKNFNQAKKLLDRALEIWTDHPIINEHIKICNQSLQQEGI